MKIENLLLDKECNLKIADFGLSINKQGNYGLGVMYSRVGTKNYMAPEILEVEVLSSGNFDRCSAQKLVKMEKVLGVGRYQISCMCWCKRWKVSFSEEGAVTVLG